MTMEPPIYTYIYVRVYIYIFTWVCQKSQWLLHQSFELPDLTLVWNRQKTRYMGSTYHWDMGNSTWFAFEPSLPSPWKLVPRNAYRSGDPHLAEKKHKKKHEFPQNLSPKKHPFQWLEFRPDLLEVYIFGRRLAFRNDLNGFGANLGKWWHFYR